MEKRLLKLFIFPQKSYYIGEFFMLRLKALAIRSISYIRICTSFECGNKMPYI